MGSASRRGTPRILVVDDEPAVRGVIERILTSAGHDVETAATHGAAEERLARGDIDVALCDLCLDGSSGLDVIRSITARHRDTRAVAVTGVADSPAVAQAFEAGAVGYVTKPFKRSDILIAIEQALRSRALDNTRAEERRQMERELRERADCDPLTGLFNRRRFAEELDRHLRLCSRSGGEGALLLCDLDHFKIVNDTLGHAAGDDVLRRVTRILRDRLRASDVIARLGGDEFAILLTETPEAEAMAVASEIQRLLADPTVRPRTGASIGVACFTRSEALVADDLMVAADSALYSAKEAGRDRVAKFEGPKAKSLTWIERIQNAVDRDALVVYSQPIVDLRSGCLGREELLVRMRDSDGGLIPPGLFLPTAERFGLVEHIDAWVLERALALVGGGRAVTVNLSAKTMQAGGFIDSIETAVRRGVDVSLLTLEITETAAVSNIELVRDLAERLSRLGCELALDDFGTGFGAFTYLKHLPIDLIKIDAEFVRDLAHSRTDQRMIRAMVEIARAAGQRTVAEGVEDVMSLDLLRRYGVDFAQGFYLGRPAEVDDQPPALASGATQLYASIHRRAIA
jgi:diguanylate cyclase (GGDEF)-like protein